jgi:hypothetical protein
LPCRTIIGLNRHGCSVALGIVEAVDEAGILVRSPLESLGRIDRVAFGEMRMS